MRKICNILFLCLMSTGALMAEDAPAGIWGGVDNEKTSVNQGVEILSEGQQGELTARRKRHCHKRPTHCHHHKNRFEVDYIIVGDGTAGAVLARKLSDNRKNRVVVLEAGRNRTTDPVVLNPNPFAVQNEITFNPKYSISYPISLFFPGEVTVYSEGRMWGGCSAHNYVLTVRGTPSVYDFWALASGNPFWTYNNLLPLMIGLEHYTPDMTIANPEQRGFNGPLFITQTPPVSHNNVAIAISNVTSAPLISDYNDPTETVGETAVSASQQYITPPPDSIRSFSSTAFLPVGTVIDANGRGLDGRKLQIVSNAYTTRVIFKGNKAIGVEYILDDDVNTVLRVFARKKVILSAGSINTPAILQRSGIGDPATLEPLGIPVLVNNPNVGANLMNQYGPSGIMEVSIGSANIAAFIDESPFMANDGIRRVQIALANLGTTTEFLGFILQPHSVGSVQIVDPNPLIQPLINLNMYSDGPVTEQGTDAYLAVSFYKILKMIADKLDVNLLFPPLAHFADDDLLLADAMSLASLVVEYHASGTARMSTSPETGVVNGNLEVFGVRNLMIVDNSVVPLIENGNTAYQAFVLGLGAAQLLGAH